jgi:hypothetical protein
MKYVTGAEDAGTARAVPVLGPGVHDASDLPVGGDLSRVTRDE